MDAPWDAFLRALRQGATLQTYDPSLELCLLTDSSDTHFACVVTQCFTDELQKPDS